MSTLYVGHQVHVVVLVHGFSSDVAICNALITMYSKCADLLKARQLFDKMNDRNVITWSAMIARYGIHAISSEDFELFEEMLTKGVTPDDVKTAVLKACSHSGLMNMGRKFFEKMNGRFGNEAWIGALHVHGRYARKGRTCGGSGCALIFGMEMEPDSALWGAFLGACKIHGKVEVAEQIAEKFYESTSQVKFILPICP